MTDIFIAIQCGVYRHEVIGAFTTLERAKAAGEAAIKAEPDHYHDIDIVLRRLDEEGPEVMLGWLRARCGAACWENKPADWHRSIRELLGIDWKEASP